jgi:hypothetical protein
LPTFSLSAQWGRLVGALACCALACLCRCSVGPNCQPLPSFNRLPARTAHTHAETAAPTSPLAPNRHLDPPPHVPACTHFPSASLISPQHTHPSCPRPFFKLTGAPPSRGLLRPNQPPAELARRPRSCSATARQSLTVVFTSPEVNFPTALPLLSPPFSLFRQLAADDRRYRYRAIVPRPLGQPQLPHAFFARMESPDPYMALAPCARPRKTVVLTRRTHSSASLLPLFVPLAWSLTGGPWIPHVSAAPNPFPRSVSPPGGLHPRVLPRRRALACPAPLSSGPGLTVAPPVRRWRPGTQSSARPSRWPVDPACQRHPSPRAHHTSSNPGRLFEI